MDARSRRCPQCGAAARSDAQRCAYCRARLATVSCPACLGLMFEGASFCERCGARRERQPETSTARCPACRGVMHGATVGAVALLECANCDGLWVDAEAFERICANREAQAAVIHTREAKPPAFDRRVTYRPCVRCGTMMNRINFSRLSGTIVDVCKGHGTFLDVGELQAIVQFIQAGGLERARQRQMDDLQRQEMQLRSRQARIDGLHAGPDEAPFYVGVGMHLGFDLLIELFRE